MATFVWSNKSELSRTTASGASGTEVEFTIQAAGPTSYTTGGEAFATGDIKAKLGIDSISFFSCEVNAASATDVVVLVYDRANSKLIALDEAGTQISGSTDLSARTFRMRVVGVRKADYSTLP
jgi:hypothetical protein